MLSTQYESEMSQGSADIFFSIREQVVQLKHSFDNLASAEQDEKLVDAWDDIKSNGFPEVKSNGFPDPNFINLQISLGRLPRSVTGVGSTVPINTPHETAGDVSKKKKKKSGKTKTDSQQKSAASSTAAGSTQGVPLLQQALTQRIETAGPQALLSQGHIDRANAEETQTSGLGSLHLYQSRLRSMDVAIRKVMLVGLLLGAGGLALTPRDSTASHVWEGVGETFCD